MTLQQYLRAVMERVAIWREHHICQWETPTPPESVAWADTLLKDMGIPMEETHGEDRDRRDPQAR